MSANRRWKVKRLAGCLLAVLCISFFSLRCSEQPDTTTEQDSALIAAAITSAIPNGVIGMEYRSITAATLNHIDVTTGVRTSRWEMPAGGWVHQIAAINADAVGLSYSPVPAEGEQPYQRAGIYALLWEGEDASLHPIIESQQVGLSLYTPVWTVDGRYIFYVRYLTMDAAVDVTLMRYEVATGEQVEIAKDGIWPHVSSAGERLTYITVNPETQERGVVVTDWDGGNMVEVVENGLYFDIDSPRFSPDNQFIYFTASLPALETSWIDWLLDVKTVQAHPDVNVPVEWMRVPVDGGEHEQLSAENKRIVFGDFSAAGDTLYFTTTDGLFSMPSAGGPFTQHSAAATMRTFIGQAPSR